MEYVFPAPVWPYANTVIFVPYKNCLTDYSNWLNTSFCVE